MLAVAILVLVLPPQFWALSSTAPLPKLLGQATIDYSGASEFIEEHYSISNYFGADPTRREEPIFDAREGVLVSSSDQDGGVSHLHVPSLQNCGFACIEAPTDVQDFEDLEQVQRIYAKELKELIPRALEVDPGQVESISFWHPMVRGEAITPRHRSQDQPAVATAAQMVHIDTDVGAYGLEGILGLVQNNLLSQNSTTTASFDREAIHKQLAVEQRRFLFLNTWRPLTPVKSRPLAIWATRYPKENGMFPTMRPHLDTSRWYVFPEMQPSECLIFKQYDRRRDAPCDFWHTSVDVVADEEQGGYYPPRRSFDMKVMVVLKETVEPENDRLAASTAPVLTLEESTEFCGKQADARGV